MGLLKALIGASIGGAIGAGIWAAISYNTGYEVGYVAWGIGLLCGIGALMLARADADQTTGIIAALVAVASVAGGKYLASHMYVGDFMKSASGITVDDDMAKTHLAGQLVKEYTNDGKPLKWPPEMDAESAEEFDDYPADLRADAETRWTAMSETDREAYRASIKAQFDYAVSEITSSLESDDFFANIGPMDILFFGLAIITAYRVGAGGFGGGDD